MEKNVTLEESLFHLCKKNLIAIEDLYLWLLANGWYSIGGMHGNMKQAKHQMKIATRCFRKIPLVWVNEVNLL